MKNGARRSFRLPVGLPFLAGLVAGVALGGQAHAEEGVFSHYLQGTIADFMGTVPPRGTFTARADVFRYSGSNDVNRLPVAGLTASDTSATMWGVALTASIRPSWDLANKLSWAGSITLPILSVSVDALVEGPNGILTRRSEDLTNVGDMIVTPVILLYTFTPDLAANARLVVYPPTGRYQTDRLANTGKNFFTVDPVLGVTYFGSTNGIEATIYGGIDVNTLNASTQYRSGTQLHADATLAWHVRIRDGMLGAGGTGYWYQQVGSDSGTGARLGASKARALGAGPVVSYVTPIANIPFTFELKWIDDFAVERHIDGQLWFFKILAAFH